MEAWIPGLIAGSFAVLVAVVSGYFQNRREISDQLTKTTSPTPPSTSEVWQRLDRMEKGFRAAMQILETLAEQWPGKCPPELPKKALKTLKEMDMLPPEWEDRVE